MPAPKVTVICAPSPAEIDEFCRLSEQRGPIEKRYKHLKDKIEKSKPQLAKDPLATAEFEGLHFILKVGVQSEKSEVTGIEQIYRFLGIRKFIQFVKRCQITLKALEETIPDESIRQQFIVTDRSGWRRFDVTRKFPESAA
jgi:hypothetical protein